MSDAVQPLHVLRTDRQSGSSEILRKTIKSVIKCLEKGYSRKEILKELDELCKYHSSMALLQSFYRFFRSGPVSGEKVKEWLNTYAHHEAAASRHFGNRLATFHNILVHSNSGLLFSSLKSVKKKLKVFCTEGRPSFEGRLLAERLSKLKHEVCLITDIAAFSVIPRIEVLAFGCDTVTPRGIINKIGSAPMARAATESGKKVYFVGTSEKRTKGWSEKLLQRQGANNEIYRGKKKIHVENRYFDVTPWDDITGVFFEDGISTGRNLKLSSPRVKW